MNTKPVRFPSTDPLRAFRKPSRVWSLEGTCAPRDGQIWVQCYGTAHAHLVNEDTLVLSFPLHGGTRQDIWFARGLHFPHGLVIGLSADQYEFEPLSAVPDGMELTISYKTDAEIAHDAVMHARWKRHPDDPHSLTLSLLDFFRTGKLGPIHLGMARAAVLDILGRPDNWSVAVNDDGQPAIFMYGDVEFYFDGSDTLTCLRADNFDVLSGGDGLRLDSWLPRRGMALHQVEEQLTLQGIGYQRTRRPSDPPDMMIIQLTSGVELGFQSPDEAVFVLESISRRGGREK